MSAGESVLTGKKRTKLSRGLMPNVGRRDRKIEADNKLKNSKDLHMKLIGVVEDFRLKLTWLGMMRVILQLTRWGSFKNGKNSLDEFSMPTIICLRVIIYYLFTLLNH